MDILKKINAFIGKVEAFIIASFVIAMSALLIGNVISRTVFNSSLTYAEEVGRIMIIVITFIGLSYAARYSKHVKMSAIIDLLPLKVKKIFYIVTPIMTSVILFYVCYRTTAYVISVAALGRVTPALSIPTWYTLIPIPIGFFLAGFQYLIIFLLNQQDKSNIFIGSEMKEEEQLISKC